MNPPPFAPHLRARYLVIAVAQAERYWPGACRHRRSGYSLVFGAAADSSCNRYLAAVLGSPRPEIAFSVIAAAEPYLYGGSCRHSLLGVIWWSQKSSFDGLPRHFASRTDVHAHFEQPRCILAVRPFTAFTLLSLRAILCTSFVQGHTSP